MGDYYGDIDNSGFSDSVLVRNGHGNSSGRGK